VSFAHSSEVGRGLVVRQDPPAGASARRDAEVDVVVSRGPAQVQLPDFVGKPEQEARATLDELGVTTESVERNDESVAPGIVMSQNPPAGRTVLGGTKVTLVVSTGPAIRQVPELKGIALEGAAFRIGQAGLDLGQLQLADDPAVPAGAIISSTPAPGEQVPRDSKVDLVVSSGLPALGVPNVVGKSQAAATNQLGDVGFIVGQIIQTGTVDDPDDGKVVGQDPAPNTLLKPGQVVTITVRKAAIPSTTVPTPGGG
jgi:serine/threonine-protein kinase